MADTTLTAPAIAPRSGSSGLRAAALGLTWLVCLATAAWLAASWYANPTNDDGTCGALYRPDLWRDQWRACGDLVVGQSMQVLVLVGLAVAVLVAVLRPAGRLARAAPALTAVSLLACALALLVNEAGRDMGAFA